MIYRQGGWEKIIGMTPCPKVSRRAGRDRYNDVAYPHYDVGQAP